MPMLYSRVPSVCALASPALFASTVGAAAAR